MSHAAIAIKESAHVGDKSSKRLAKGVDDLGKWRWWRQCTGWEAMYGLGGNVRAGRQWNLEGGGGGGGKEGRLDGYHRFENLRGR